MTHVADIGHFYAVLTVHFFCLVLSEREEHIMSLIHDYHVPLTFSWKY